MYDKGNHLAALSIAEYFLLIEEKSHFTMN